LSTYSLVQNVCRLKAGVNKTSLYSTKILVSITNKFAITELFDFLRLEKFKTLRSKQVTYQYGIQSSHVVVSVLISLKTYLGLNLFLIGLKRYSAGLEGLTVLLRFSLSRNGYIPFLKTNVYGFRLSYFFSFWRIELGSRLTTK